MRRASLLFLVPLLALCALAGCGGGGGGGAGSTAAPPDLGTLAADTVTATQSQQSAHFALNATISVEGSSSNPLLQLLTSNPIKLGVQGDASPSALTTNGTVSVLGKDLSAKLLADQQGLYLNVLGTWYGSPQLGIDALKQLAQGRMSASPGTSDLQTLEQVRRHADEILTGDVSEGPTLDGVSTWEFTGHLNADGIANLAEQQGQALTPRQQDALKTIEDSLTVTLDTGKDDHLVRHFELTLDLNSDQLESLSSTSSTSGVSGLHVSLTVDTSNWGEAVSVTPPASYKPLTDLTQGLAGLLQSS